MWAAPVRAAEVLEPAASILIGPCESRKPILWKDVLSSQSPSPSWPSLFPPEANALPRALTEETPLSAAQTPLEAVLTCRTRTCEDEGVVSPTGHQLDLFTFKSWNYTSRIVIVQKPSCTLRLACSSIGRWSLTSCHGDGCVDLWAQCCRLK